MGIVSALDGKWDQNIVLEKFVLEEIVLEEIVQEEIVLEQEIVQLVQGEARLEIWWWNQIWSIWGY